MRWVRLIFLPSIVTFLLLSTGPVSSSAAPESREIESITVLAESGLSIPMSQISSLFSQNHPISVSSNFGDTQLQKKKIEDGESSDVFITSQPDLIDQLKTKGLVDVYSIGKIVSSGGLTYSVAVVAGENMTPARVFLDFLKSEDAKGIFTKNGFTTP